MTDTNGGDGVRKWEGTIGDNHELLLIPTDKGGSSAKSLNFFVFWPLAPGLTAKYKGGADYTWTVKSAELMLVE